MCIETPLAGHHWQAVLISPVQFTSYSIPFNILVGIHLELILSRLEKECHAFGVGLSGEFCNTRVSPLALEHSLIKFKDTCLEFEEWSPDHLPLLQQDVGKGNKGSLPIRHFTFLMP